MTLVVTEVNERVASVRLARLEKKNALTAEMYDELAAALRAAESDRGVRAVLLHGSEDCFCAGNDMADFLKPRSPGEFQARGLFEVLPRMQKPVVAAVGGPAIGIGTTMLLHCDLVYAATNARFQLPFVPLGIVPEFGSTFLLPLIAGYRRAAELLLLGQPFDAAKAYEAGLVSAVVSPGELLQKSRSAALALAALPPESVRLTKQLLKRRYSPALDEAIGKELELFHERLGSPEAKEAIGAFLEKRKPDFSRF